MSNVEPLSISERIRMYIKEVHQNDKTYFETQSEKVRMKDFQLFCSKNSNSGINFQLHRNMLITQIRKLAPELKIDLNKLGLRKLDSNTFKVTKGNQIGNIRVNPKVIKTIAQVDPRSASNIPQQQTTQANPNQQSTQQQNIPHPVLCQCFQCLQSRGIYQEMDDETAGAPFEVLADIWHAKNSKFKLLSKDEVKRLGKAWSPIFSRYIGGDIMLFLLPIVITAQCFMGRVMESKGEKKDSTEKKRDEANKKTSDKKNNRDYNDKPTEGSNSEIVKRKFYSNEKVQKIIDEGKKDG